MKLAIEHIRLIGAEEHKLVFKGRRKTIIYG